MYALFVCCLKQYNTNIFFPLVSYSVALKMTAELIAEVKLDTVEPIIRAFVQGNVHPVCGCSVGNTDKKKKSGVAPEPIECPLGANGLGFNTGTLMSLESQNKRFINILT